MKICVRDAFSSFSYHKEYDCLYTPYDLPYGAFTKEVNAHVTVSSSEGVVTCTFDIKADFKTECSRCLKEFDYPFKVTVKKIVRREEDEDLEDIIYVDSDMHIDIDEEIRTLIYFEFPAKPLCRNDCKGLCPVCGCDLNTTNCSCDIRTTDPRLAVLKNLFDK